MNTNYLILAILSGVLLLSMATAPLLAPTQTVSAQDDPTTEDEDYDIPIEPDGSTAFDYSSNIDVNSWDNVDGGAIVNFGVGLDVETYPYRYPTSVAVRAYDPDTGELVEEVTTTVTLRPFTDDDDSYQNTGTANFTFNQNDATEYRFELDIQSDMTNNSTVSETQTIEGINDETQSNISVSITDQGQFRTLPTIENVQSYQISNSGNAFQENSNLPSYEGDFSGSVSQFANMTVYGSENATVRSEDGELNMTTSTQFVESGEPQTLVIRSAITGTEDISLNVIDGVGEEIDSETTYTLTDDINSVDHNVIEGNVSNIHIIKLSEEERSYLNSQGELFLSYSASGDNVQADMYCQDLISGSMTFSSSACGVTGVEGSPSSDVFIQNFDLYDNTTDSLFNAGGDIRVPSADSLAESDLYVDIINTGSEPIPADEELFVYSNTNPEFDIPENEAVEYTSPDDFSQTPNNETFTLDLPQSYPASAVTLELEGQTNDGVIEVLAEDGGQTYQRVRTLDGTTQINLGDIGGQIQSVDITLNTNTNPGGTSPTVNSVTGIVQEVDAESQWNLEVGENGQGELEQGETRSYQIDPDWATLLDPDVTFYAQIRNDTQPLFVRTSGTDIVADAGGPYHLELDRDGTTREVIGQQQVRAVEQPGDEFEHVRTLTEQESTDTYTTTHQLVPEVNLSTQDSLGYWEDNDYISDPVYGLPPNTQDEWTPVGITYTNQRTTQNITGTRDGVDSFENPYSFSEANWQTVEVGGRTISRMDLEPATLQYIASTGRLEWDIDGGGIYYPLDEATFDNDSTQIVTVIVVEQQSDPSEFDDILRCDDSEIGGAENLADSDEDTCWRDNGVIDYKQTDPTGEDEDRLYYTEDDLDNDEPLEPEEHVKCLGSYYDPGPDWYYVGYTDTADSSDCSDSSGEYFIWSQAKTEEFEIREWEQIANQKQANLHVPQTEPFDVYERNVYDVEIEWERNVNTDDVSIWEGPEYVSVPEHDMSTLRLVSESEPGNMIDTYEWEVEETGQELEGSLVDLEIDPEEIEGSDSLTLSHRVVGSGQEDIDTTDIDIIRQSGEDDPIRRGGTRSSQVSINNFTEKTDYRYQQGAIDIEVTRYRTANAELELVVEPGTASIVVNQSNDGCADYYERVDESDVDLSEYDVTFYSDSNDVEPDSEGRFCVKTVSDDTGGPEIFEHPDAIGLESRVIELSGRNVSTPIWQGQNLPIDDLRKVAYIDPIQNKSITPGTNEFEVRLQYAATGTTIDSETVEIEFCDAKSAIYECAELDSDLDLENDPDDLCPYVPNRSPPCDTFGPSEGVLTWGESTELADTTEPKWNIESDNTNVITDHAYFGGDGYSNRNYKNGILMVGANPSQYDDVIGHYPLDDNAQRANIFDVRQADDSISGGQDAEIFVGPDATQDIGQKYWGEIYIEHSSFSGGEKYFGDVDNMETEPDESQFEISISEVQGVRTVRVYLDEDPDGNYGAQYIGEFQYNTFDHDDPDTSDINVTLKEENKMQEKWGQTAPVGAGLEFSDEIWMSVADYENDPDNTRHEAISDELIDNSNVGLSISGWANPDLSGPAQQAIVDTTGNIPKIVATTEHEDIDYINKDRLKIEEYSDQEYHLVYTKANGYDIVIDAVSQDGFGPDSLDDYEIRGYHAFGDQSHPVYELRHQDSYTIASVQYLGMNHYLTEDDNSTNIRTKYLRTDDEVETQTSLTLSGSDGKTYRYDPDDISAQVPKIPVLVQMNSETVHDIGQDAVVFQHSGWRHFQTNIVSNDIMDPTITTWINGKPKTNANELQYDRDRIVDNPDQIKLLVGGAGGGSTWFGFGSNPTEAFFEGEMNNIIIQGSGDSIDSTYPNQTSPDDTRTDVDEQSLSQEVRDSVSMENDIEWDDVAFRKDTIFAEMSVEWTQPTFRTNGRVLATFYPTEVEDGQSPPNDAGYYRVEWVYNGVGNPVGQQVDNNLKEDVNFTSFDADVSIYGSSSNPHIGTQIDNINLRSDSPGELAPVEIVNTEIETTGSNLTVPEGDPDDGGSGGLSTYRVDIEHNYEEPQTVNARWIASDNETQIATDQISVDDTTTLSAERTWLQLTEDLEPRDTPYTIEVEVESPNGDIERVEVDEIILCDPDGDACD